MSSVRFIASVLMVAFAGNFCWSAYRRYRWLALGEIRILYEMPPVYGWHLVGAICAAGVWWLV